MKNLAEVVFASGLWRSCRKLWHLAQVCTAMTTKVWSFCFRPEANNNGNKRAGGACQCFSCSPLMMSIFSLSFLAPFIFLIIGTMC